MWWQTRIRHHILKARPDGAPPRRTPRRNTPARRHPPSSSTMRSRSWITLIINLLGAPMRPAKPTTLRTAMGQHSQHLANLEDLNVVRSRVTGQRRSEVARFERTGPPRATAHDRRPTTLPGTRPLTIAAQHPNRSAPARFARRTGPAATLREPRLNTDRRDGARYQASSNARRDPSAGAPPRCRSSALAIASASPRSAVAQPHRSTVNRRR
jgi:hypothetical protein